MLDNRNYLYRINEPTYYESFTSALTRHQSPLSLKSYQESLSIVLVRTLSLLFSHRLRCPAGVIRYLQ